MKNLIAIAAIIVSFALVAQHGKGNGNKGGGHGNSGGGKSGHGLKIKPGGDNGGGKISIKPKGNKGGSNVKVKQQGGANHKPFKGNSSHSNSAKGKNKVYHPVKKGNNAHASNKFHYKKGHVNHVYMYTWGPIYYPTKNYGQWRSLQARNKHKHYHPILEIDAHNAIVMIHDRNAFLYVEIGSKIDRYERLVIARHSAGIITDVEYSAHLVRIKRYRQTHVEFNFYL